MTTETLLQQLETKKADVAPGKLIGHYPYSPQQHIAVLSALSELERLRRWKEEAMSTMQQLSQQKGAVEQSDEEAARDHARTKYSNGDLNDCGEADGAADFLAGCHHVRSQQHTTGMQWVKLKDIQPIATDEIRAWACRESDENHGYSYGELEYNGYSYYTNGKRIKIEQTNIEWLEESPKATGMQWVSVEERLPKLIEGKDYSENVLAICGGNLMVMAYCHSNDEEIGGYYWANCYGDINGDPEWDDNYEPTHWMPLPASPALPQSPNADHSGENHKPHINRP